MTKIASVGPSPLCLTGAPSFTSLLIDYPRTLLGMCMFIAIFIENTLTNTFGLVTATGNRIIVACSGNFGRKIEGCRMILISSSQNFSDIA
jgi:hypothetical protein